MTDHTPGYWPSRWPAEDGGPRRQESPRSGPGLRLEDGEHLVATTRDALVATMVVLRDPGEVYLLCHTGGPDAISWVEQVDPISLETIRRSPDLLGGKTWPGGLAAHANGDLYVAFGRHAHRLGADLSVLASRALPRDRPYNSFVILPDGHLALKDFGGELTDDIEDLDEESCELLALDPVSLATVSAVTLPERSVARLSADGDDIYVVGVDHLWRVRWTGTDLVVDEAFQPRYRTEPGQTYGWDAVIAGGAAWFLDNGEGTNGYAGSFIGQGISPGPLHLVRVDLSTAAVTLTEICGLPNGIVANPPAVDAARAIAVGYDSANGVLAAFDIAPDGALTPRWRRDQHHACHPILYPDTGELVTADYNSDRMMEQLVVLDISTGEERGRVDTGSPIQSPVFPATGFDRDLYYVSFAVLCRVSVATTG